MKARDVGRMFILEKTIEGIERVRGRGSIGAIGSAREVGVGALDAIERGMIVAVVMNVIAIGIVDESSLLIGCMYHSVCTTYYISSAIFAFFQCMSILSGSA